ncbi:DUF2147 domain-containing protein [Parendozoicomonas haliclonae]|uniref:DUF2147 domain-containing protein n=1 Tax=Parendozoicomonas haliclonae TaxID=1960125 RepID=A0A1X7AQD0_9GAMM|nr:DUF2147 domain-containing protein [Parendozoicomonas haliclonae]SMA50531.1 hypothetical protein EHSB41UT_04342 [Parendozoicomonas haliclonae]
MVQRLINAGTDLLPGLPTRIPVISRTIGLLLVCISSSLALAGPKDITGYWDAFTSDKALDTTLRISPTSEPDVLEARIAKLHLAKDQGAVCNVCPDYRKGQPLQDMVIVSDLRWNDGKKGWYGQVLDPESGRTADVRLRRIEGKSAEKNGIELCAFFASDFVCLFKDTWKPSQLTE